MVPNRHEAKRVVYRFYATTEGVPRRLDMRGQNSLSEAHLDHWVNSFVFGDSTKATWQLGRVHLCSSCELRPACLPACCYARRKCVRCINLHSQPARTMAGR